MAVIHHGLRWRMSAPACAAAAAAAERAQAGDAAGLSALGGRFHRAADRFPATLAAFALGDRDYVRSWLAPEAVHPALVTLLAWVPALDRLGGRDAGTLAALHREGGSPVAPLTAVGAAFRPLAGMLEAVFGRSPLAARPTAGDLGMWARAARLERRLRRNGDHAAAGRVAAMTGADAERTWLVTTSLW